MFFTKIPLQKVTSKSRFHHTVLPYFSYAARSRQSETYQNIHGRFLANLPLIYFREKEAKEGCWILPSQTQYGWSQSEQKCLAGDKYHHSIKIHT